MKREWVLCLGDPNDDHYFWSRDRKHNRICPKCERRLRGIRTENVLRVECIRRKQKHEHED